MVCTIFTGIVLSCQGWTIYSSFNSWRPYIFRYRCYMEWCSWRYEWCKRVGKDILDKCSVGSTVSLYIFFYSLYDVIWRPHLASICFCFFLLNHRFIRRRHIFLFVWCIFRFLSSFTSLRFYQKGTWLTLVCHILEETLWFIFM